MSVPFKASAQTKGRAGELGCPQAFPGWGTMPAFCAFDLEAWPCCPLVPEQGTPRWAREGVLGPPHKPAAAWTSYLCSMELPFSPSSFLPHRAGSEARREQ